jgi:hypothetical protein
LIPVAVNAPVTPSVLENVPVVAATEPPLKFVAVVAVVAVAAFPVQLPVKVPVIPPVALIIPVE